MNNLPFNWFDLALLLIISVGIQRGRKHGLSEELIPLSKWMVIVIACAFLYEPIGRFIADTTVFSLLAAYRMAYFAVGLVILIAAAMIKRAIGGKLLGSDVFGRGEYYFGMAAGGLRFICVLFVVLAFLNARYYSKPEIDADQKYQQDVYGKSFFPEVYTIQAEVFHGSFTGRLIHDNLFFLLIKPTPPAQKQFKQKDFEMPS